MAQDETGRRGGASMGAKTARPSSVGPHHRTRDQEEPGNPGIRPEEGYGAEIARNNAAASRQPAGKAAVVAPTPKAGRTSGDPEPGGTAEEPDHAPTVAPTPPQAETADESGGTEEMLRRSGPPRDAPPLSGTAKE